jgi:hypothetical protein
LRLSFSASLSSPSSGFPFGQNHEGRAKVSATLLALAPHRTANKAYVMRLIHIGRVS